MSILTEFFQESRLYKLSTCFAVNFVEKTSADRNLLEQWRNWMQIFFTYAFPRYGKYAVSSILICYMVENINLLFFFPHFF